MKGSIRKRLLKSKERVVRRKRRLSIPTPYRVTFVGKDPAVGITIPASNNLFKRHADIALSLGTQSLTLLRPSIIKFWNLRYLSILPEFTRLLMTEAFSTMLITDRFQSFVSNIKFRFSKNCLYTFIGFSEISLQYAELFNLGIFHSKQFVGIDYSGGYSKSYYFLKNLSLYSAILRTSWVKLFKLFSYFSRNFMELLYTEQLSDDSMVLNYSGRCQINERILSTSSLAKRLNRSFIRQGLIDCNRVIKLLYSDRILSFFNVYRNTSRAFKLSTLQIHKEFYGKFVHTNLFAARGCNFFKYSALFNLIVHFDCDWDSLLQQSANFLDTVGRSYELDKSRAMPAKPYKYYPFTGLEYYFNFFFSQFTVIDLNKLYQEDLFDFNSLSLQYSLEYYIVFQLLVLNKIL